MKLCKPVFIILALIFIFAFSSCENNGTNDPDTETVSETSDAAADTITPTPDITERETETEAPLPDFWFSITWDASRSTYNSATGYLANDMYSTTLILSEDELNSIKKLIEDADITSFADNYEGPKSKPHFTLNLEVSMNGVKKKIESNCSFTLIERSIKGYDYDETMLRYVSLCYEIVKIIRNTEEFQNLPKGKIYM